MNKNMKNSSFSELASALLSKEPVLLFPHENPDGDALGSCRALCSALRKLGKSCCAVISENLPEYLAFLDDDGSFFRNYREIALCGSEYAACLVDCGSEYRIDERAELYGNAELRLCIDHHRNDTAEADLYLIDAGRAACAELIYEIIRELERQSGKSLLDKACASALYVGICTDSGKFQYSNTTAKTHSITAKLLESGASPSELNLRLYQSNRPEKTRLLAAALSKMELFAGGRAAVAAISKEMLSENKALPEDSEGIVEELRAVKGVEIALLLREEKGRVKASLRAKEYADVARIAERFGGGGHLRAAGCTLSVPLEEAKERLKRAAEEALGFENCEGR